MRESHSLMVQQTHRLTVVARVWMSDSSSNSTHSYAWHDSFMKVRNTTHAYAWHDSFMSVRDTTHGEKSTCFAGRMSDGTHVNEWGTHVHESCHTYEWVVSKFLWMSCATHLNQTFRNARVFLDVWFADWDILVCDDTTGWRRFIGCFNLQVSFRKRATNHRALLRKMTYEDKASYDSTPSVCQICDMTHSYVWHVPRLIHTCDTTHSYVWHGSFICVTWLIHMRDVTHSLVWRDLFMCDMTHSYV